MNTLTIGIIGGTGGMGRLFAPFFERRGHRVLIAGRRTALTYRQLAADSDIVIISTPQEAGIPIIRDIGPLLDENKLLMDFCSLKADIVDAMLTHSKAEVIGTHPLFGPFTTSFKRQNIIICPARGTAWINWCEETLRAEGACVSQMTPTDHDRHMAIVQGLTHFITICVGRTFMKLDMQPKAALHFATPLFRLNMDLVGRLFAQDPSLYSSLVSKNKNIDNILKVFFKAMDESRSALFDNRVDALAFLKEIRDFLGSFCEEALDESNLFLDALYQAEEDLLPGKKYNNETQ